MKPLYILTTVTVITAIILHRIHGETSYPFAARIGMTAMLFFTALGHFMFTKGMVKMIPDVIPYKKGMVYLTAIFEMAAGVGLHIPQLRTLAACLLILFFVLILPANIKAAQEKLDYQSGNYDGKGMEYLWFRIPLQILFILWVYFSAIH